MKFRKLLRRENLPATTIRSPVVRRNLAIGLWGLLITFTYGAVAVAE